MTLSDRMSSTKPLYDSHPLGWQVHEAAVKVLKGFDLRLTDMYVWVDEVIAEAKKTLAVEDIKLLPKTPSAKSRTRRCQRTLRSNAAFNSDVADLSMESLPAKKTRKKASKTSKKVNLVEDSSMLNEVSRLEEVDEEEDAQNEDANISRTFGKQKAIDEAAASKESTGDSSSVEVKNAEQGKENFDRTGYKTSDKLEACRPLNSRDVLNMAAAILDGNYKASSVLTTKTNPSNDYTPSSARKLFGYVKSALSSIVPSLTAAPAETSNCIQQSDGDNLSTKEIKEQKSEEKLAAVPLNPELMKKQSASSNQHTDPSAVSSEMAEQNSKPLANRKQNRRVSNSKNGLRRASLRLKVKRLSTSKPSSKRLSIKASKRLLDATKKSKKSEVMHSENIEVKNECIQVDMSTDEEIEDTPPARGQVVKSNAQENKNSEILNLGGTIGTMKPPSNDALPVRSTRFKMKDMQQLLSSPTKKESQRVTKEDGKLVGVAVNSELRCTRSKTRDLQTVSSPVITAQATPPNSSSGVSTADTPSTATRSKGNKIKQLQELLCKDPGFGLKPAQTAADDQPSNTRRRSSKRQQEPGSDNESRAKRHCNETDKISPNQATVSASDSIQDSKNNVKGIYVSSCYPVLKKAPTPNSQSTASFLQRNTPKVCNRQEMQEVGRKTLAVKVKKMEEMAQKKNEELQKKAEEQKRLREEHHISVLKRRQELEQSTVKKGPSKLDESSSTIKTNDREKSKLGTLRERRLAEAEQRRKQEEEARQQNFLQQEKEKQMLEEQQRRRKEQEEQERQQRIAEQRRLEEERRLRQERERQEEQERLRKLELQRLKEEEEKRKQKEERERKEKAERDRLELEKQQKKEKQRQLELEKKKELERQKIAEEQARLEVEQRKLEEQRNLQKVIEKHNQTLKQIANLPSSASCNSIQKTQTIASSSVVLVKCSAQTQPGSTVGQAQAQQASASAKPTLNTTYEKEGIAKAATHNSCDSYEMTPRIKKVKTTSTDSNYNIDDLNSEDSTDDESQPRKKIPLWAQGNQLKIALISQITDPPDVDKLFGHISSPDLNLVFTKKRARFNKRTSSANWDEPALPMKTNTL